MYPAMRCIFDFVLLVYEFDFIPESYTGLSTHDCTGSGTKVYKVHSLTIHPFDSRRASPRALLLACTRHAMLDAAVGVATSGSSRVSRRERTWGTVMPVYWAVKPAFWAGVVSVPGEHSAVKSAPVARAARAF